MNPFVKNLGLVIQLSGVLILAIPYFLKKQTNTTLLLGLGFVVLGFLLYIIINRTKN